MPDMARNAAHVVSAPSDVMRIEQLVVELPSQARVRITQRNGEVFTGTVTERPALQVFETCDGGVGLNAQVRLDDPAAPPWTVYLWLGDIAKVERIDPL